MKKKNEPAKETQDVFRRTGLKFGESEEEKKKRLARCVNVLKQAGNDQVQFRTLSGISEDPRTI